MSNGYLSKDRARLARQQRERRARQVRIDYMPGAVAQAVIEAKRTQLYPDSVAATNSAILDAIVSEWARVIGINYRQVDPPMTPAVRDQYAHARMSSGETEALKAAPLSDPDRSVCAEGFGGTTGIAGRFAGAPARAYDFGTSEGATKPARVICGARRHRDGQPCEGLSEPGKRRCRYHGGRSTGPRTEEGRKRSLLNLRQGGAQILGD